MKLLIRDKKKEKAKLKGDLESAADAGKKKQKLTFGQTFVPKVAAEQKVNIQRVLQ